MMQLGLYGAAWIIVLAINLGIVTRTSGMNVQNQQTQNAADQTRVRNYLEEIKPGKKWRSGPTAMDSQEIRMAYGNTRFYSVYSSPPRPPGAPLPALVEEYQRKADEHQKQFISMTVRIDAQENMAPLYEANDFNQGLMRIATDDDAKTCAAAILSLYISDRAGPGIVSAKEVTVTKDQNGWKCVVSRKNAFWGEVVFDKEGKVVSVKKASMAPLPS